jgi:FixJ family two-component response regulator
MHNPDEIIFVIDDDSSVRRSLTLFLTTVDYRVETFAGSEEFLKREVHNGTGCIILDVNLEGKSGLELQDELLALDLSLPIIFITGKGSIPMSVITLKKGAINFLEKPIKNEELLQSIAEALALSKKSKANRKEIDNAHRLMEGLTPRETEIVKYIINGMLNKQIAYVLGITEHTVKLHRHSICEKLGVKSVPEILQIARIAGIKPFVKVL